jgi:hypothetical protein
MTMVTVNFILLFLLNSKTGITESAIAVIFIGINTIYMMSLFKFLGMFINKLYGRRMNLFSSEYTGTVVFILMVTGASLLSACIFLSGLEKNVYIVQIPKGLVIYYSYYRILNRTFVTN